MSWGEKARAAVSKGGASKTTKPSWQKDKAASTDSKPQWAQKAANCNSAGTVACTAAGGGNFSLQIRSSVDSGTSSSSSTNTASTKSTPTKSQRWRQSAKPAKTGFLPKPAVVEPKGQNTSVFSGGAGPGPQKVSKYAAGPGKLTLAASRSEPDLGANPNTKAGKRLTMAQQKVKMGQLLEKKRKTDLRGMLKAKRQGTLNEYMKQDMIKAGITEAAFS
jgi:hypothetical protein